MARVVLAMSGGVDSSVAAWLLREQGHEVIGVFMRHGQAPAEACSVGDERTAQVGGLTVLAPRSARRQGCCSAADADDARRVAQRLEIPFYAINFDEEFAGIVDYFVDEYSAGRTPNPCVVCNTQIKFGKLFDYAAGVGAEFVATGHYARLDRSEPGEPALRRGLDRAKDQSYVLFGVRRDLVGQMMLPVGNFDKPAIRRAARDLGLVVADKPDSQEICFVGHGEHDEFVRRRRPGLDTAGQIVTTDGTVVGHHEGIESFTIGQRRGLGVAMGEPYFVVRIEADAQRVVIGRREQLACDELSASRVNWLIDPPAELHCLAQIRYNSSAEGATVRVNGDDRIEVRFDQPRHGVAPGQAVVLYDGDRVLGGGWIDTTGPASP